MKISVFGLGYVGLVSSACLAADGNTVIGCDVDIEKVSSLNNKKSPIVEDGLEDLINKGVSSGHLSATSNFSEALLKSDVAIICVGTPSNPNGSLDTKYVENVTVQIAEVLQKRNNYLTIIYRSTMLPGTIQNTLLPILQEKSGKKHGQGYSVLFNPEFLRETTAIKDYYSPPKTVIGCLNDSHASKVLDIYSDLPGPQIVTSIEVAEMVKYVDNCWHATKITFANEIGQICKNLEIDSHDVMDIFVQDKKLNISPYYLKPGFAYGGSCLPKDLRALSYLSRSIDVNVPLLNSSAISNQYLIENVFQKIHSMKCSKILFHGLAFKSGTDDLRESPYVILAEKLLGKGYQIKVYDESLMSEKLLGSNLKYSESMLPHLKSLMVSDFHLAADEADMIIFCHTPKSYKKDVNKSYSSKIIIDLARIDNKDVTGLEGYFGIAW
jgi:GDP-mannose 6-dehydrogenase